MRFAIPPSMLALALSLSLISVELGATEDVYMPPMTTNPIAYAASQQTMQRVIITGRRITDTVSVGLSPGGPGGGPARGG